MKICKSSDGKTGSIDSGLSSACYFLLTSIAESVTPLHFQPLHIVHYLVMRRLQESSSLCYPGIG